MRRKERGRVSGVQYFTVFVGHKHTAQLRNNNIYKQYVIHKSQLKITKIVLHKYKIK